MKTIAIHAFLILLTFVPFKGSAQETSEVTEQEKKTAIISRFSKNGTDIYSFTLLADYDEINTNQHISRIEKITQSEITTQQKKNKIEVKIDSTKVKNYDLDNLLRGIVVLNGYFSYEIID